MNQSEDKGGGGGVAAIGTTFNGERHKFTAMKIPKQCPLVLLLKVGLVKVRRL
jgi:hypothetical protein